MSVMRFHSLHIGWHERYLYYIKGTYNNELQCTEMLKPCSAVRKGEVHRIRITKSIRYVPYANFFISIGG